MTCTCIATANRQLADNGARLADITPRGSDGRKFAARVLIQTRPVDGLRPVRTTVVARYCPFCGTRYTED